MHPLKFTCLFSLSGLILSQFGLIWLDASINWYWIAFLSLPLFVPLKGLAMDKRYTYKWIGFLALVYFCIGISELVSNPQLRLYALPTTIFSTLLFLASIYYARYLRIAE